MNKLPMLILLLASLASAQSRGLSSRDYFRLQSVGEAAISPDGTRLAYTITNNGGPGRPFSQLWIMTVAGRKTVALSRGSEASSGAVWSPDGRWIAYEQTEGGRTGLFVARADGSGPRRIADIEWTNSPIQDPGEKFAWSPDSRQIAFVSAVAGPETEEAGGDPVVIRRYTYKPDYAEGLTRLNDNRRLHISVVDAAGGKARPLTEGVYSEHSIDWSPDASEVLFVSNRESDPDRFLNHDLFAVRVSDGKVRRIMVTESSEYHPRWSPDGKSIAYLGTRRGLTDLETTMEDTHVWMSGADGSGRHELGASIDNRQGAPAWSRDGKYVYCAVEERGNVHLYRLPAHGGKPEAVVADRGSLGAWSLAADGTIAYALQSPSDTEQLYLKGPGRPAEKLTDLNEPVLAATQLAEVESLTFTSNDFKHEVEAFLTKPFGVAEDSRHPLITIIHGGPHAQQGPEFHFRSQVYAARGWATLMVNYRGSTGYGQGFADAVFGDQNGNEAQDVLYGINAAIRRYPWIDRYRLGVEGVSYGGQLSAWLITQTDIFRAAIPMAPIINLVSFNYTAYYNRYLEMEFGMAPHQGNLMDVLWERSALRHVAKVKTPVLLLHGENDNDVPISESEQFYIALKDVGVETVMVRYPREGHGLREPKHVADAIDRSIAWYEKHFPK
jgi:dipeptidyl aminopeptidase/acylaminoacyl peptidase